MKHPAHAPGAYAAGKMRSLEDWLCFQSARHLASLKLLQCRDVDSACSRLHLPLKRTAP